MTHSTQATYMTQANEIALELLNMTQFNRDELESTIDLLKELINETLELGIDEDITDEIILITSQLEELYETSADQFIEENEVDNYLEELFNDCYSNEIENLPDLIKNNIDTYAIIRDMRYDYSCQEITVDSITFYLYYNS